MIFHIFLTDAPRITSTFGFVENVTESSKSYFLECLADANPMPVIQWLRDKVTLTSNISTTIIKSNDAGSFLRSRLEFKDGVKRKDHGVYQCSASNIIGSHMKSVIINVWCKFAFFFRLGFFMESFCCLSELNKGYICFPFE